MKANAKDANGVRMMLVSRKTLMSAMGGKLTLGLRPSALVMDPAHRPIAAVDTHTEATAASRNRDVTLSVWSGVRKALKHCPTGRSVLLHIQHVTRALFCCLAAADNHLCEFASNLRIRDKRPHANVTLRLVSGSGSTRRKHET